MTIPRSWLLVLFAVAGQASAADGDQLVGTWVAHPEVRGQTGELVLYFEEDPNRQLTAFLELPPIGSRRIGLGPAVLEGTKLQSGPFMLELDEGKRELAGVLPEALVPGVTVRAVFRKADSPPSENGPRDLGVSKEPAWDYATGNAIWGGTLVGEDSVFFGNDDGYLYSLETDGGKLRWRIKTDGAIRSTPVSVGEDIVFQSDDGYLYRLGKEDGSTTWRTPLSRDDPKPVERGAEDFVYDHYASAVRVAGDVGYLGTFDGDVVCVDLRTGGIRWRFATDGPVLGTPAISGDLVLGASFDQHVYALDSASGALKWKADAGGDVVSSPAVYSDTIVFVGTRSYDLVAFDLATGKRRWDHYFWFSWVESPPYVVGDAVLAGGSDGGAVLAFDAISGRKLWEFDTTGSVWASLAHDARSLYVGAVGVRDYIVAHEPGFFAVDLWTGRGIWNYVPKTAAIGGGPTSGFAAAPAVGGGFVYAGALDGRLYAFETGPSGEPSDVISTASPMTSSPDEDPGF